MKDKLYCPSCGKILLKSVDIAFNDETSMCVVKDKKAELHDLSLECYNCHQEIGVDFERKVIKFPVYNMTDLSDLVKEGKI